MRGKVTSPPKEWSLAIKGKKILPTFLSWWRCRARAKIFTLLQYLGRRKGCYRNTYAECQLRLNHTGTASGRETSKCNNGEFQANACVSMLTAGSLSSPFIKILRCIQRDSWQKNPTLLNISLPFHNLFLVLLSLQVIGSLRILCGVLSYPLF